MSWLDGYEHDPEEGAGHNPLPGNRKVIVHTTETGPGSWRAVRDMWRGRANWAKGLPHFLADGDRYVQLLPLDTCAYTSVGGPDAANKTGTPIQIEIVGRAANGFDDVEYEALGRWIADLIAAGVDLDLEHCPRFYGDREGVVLAVSSSPVREIITRDFGGFAAFNGICGHQHLRGNEHWDPGRLDVHRVCDIARGHLTGHEPGHEEGGDDMTKEELRQELAAMAADLAGHIEAARVSIIGADTQNTENAAAVVRGEAGDLRAQWMSGLKLTLEELRETGDLPDDLDLDALTAKVASKLQAVTTITPKS